MSCSRTSFPLRPGRRALVSALLVGASGPATAASRALDPESTARIVAEAALLPKLHALIVARDGAPVIERAFRGPGLERPVNVKSVSKSVISALVGASIARGVLSGLEQPIAPVLGTRVPPDADPRVRSITVGHLLSMRAGLERTSGANYGAFAASRDWVRFVLSRPFEDEPGGSMLYSTGNTHLLSAVLTRLSGRSTLDLARDWLGGPLGIAVPPWPRDPQGIYFGGNDMLLSPRALLRFGEMYRLGGVHGDRRVLPEDWVRASWTPQARSPWSGQLHGLGWWITEARGHAVFFAWGYGGQMVYVVPSLGLTAVMTSEADGPRDRAHTDALHALLADRIIPAAA